MNALAMARKNSIFFILSVVTSFLSFVLIQAAPESALVTKVPGFSGTLPSKHYAGYALQIRFHTLSLLLCYFIRKQLLFVNIAVFFYGNLRIAIGESQSKNAIASFKLITAFSKILFLYLAVFPYVHV